MNQFDKHVEHCIERIKQTMQVKAKEYRRNDNPFHNFDRAAAMYDILPEVALTDMMAKHQVSILDIVDDIEAGNIPGVDLVAEKISDNINYLILLEGLINRRRDAEIALKSSEMKAKIVGYSIGDDHYSLTSDTALGDLSSQKTAELLRDAKVKLKAKEHIPGYSVSFDDGETYMSVEEALKRVKDEE